jgi:hypothetical protein
MAPHDLSCNPEGGFEAGAHNHDRRGSLQYAMYSAIGHCAVMRDLKDATQVLEEQYVSETNKA